MSSKLPVVSGQSVIKAFEKQGITFVHNRVHTFIYAIRCGYRLPFQPIRK
jgi:hypothetical protein